MKRNKENCSVYQNQLAAIISAENEISAQIEVLLERKKEELFNSVQVSFSIHYFFLILV